MRLKCSMPYFNIIGRMVLNKNFKGFYHISAWRQSWSFGLMSQGFGRRSLNEVGIRTTEKIWTISSACEVSYTCKIVVKYSANNKKVIDHWSHYAIPLTHFNGRV